MSAECCLEVSYDTMQEIKDKIYGTGRRVYLREMMQDGHFLSVELLRSNITRDVKEKGVDVRMIFDSEESKTLFMMKYL